MNKLVLYFVVSGIILLANTCQGQTAIKLNLGIKSSSASTYINQEITNLIISHYQKEYKEGVMSKKVNDSVIEVSFHHKPEKDNPEKYWMITMYIPRLKSNYISGPLYTSANNIVCSVNTEGGGGGGNVWWNDVFVFQSNVNSFKLISCTNSPSICGCKEGNFYPSGIEFGQIAGNSRCWGENDPHCCPSLDYKTIVKLDKDKLVFVSKTKLPALKK